MAAYLRPSLRPDHISSISMTTTTTMMFKLYHHQEGKDPIRVPLQSSNTKKTNSHPPEPFMCEICVEPKPMMNESFNIAGCSHFYCTDCTVKFIASKPMMKLAQKKKWKRCPNAGVHSCSVTSVEVQLQVPSLFPRQLFYEYI